MHVKTRSSNLQARRDRPAGKFFVPQSSCSCKFRTRPLQSAPPSGAIAAALPLRGKKPKIQFGQSFPRLQHCVPDSMLQGWQVVGAGRSPSAGAGFPDAQSIVVLHSEIAGVHHAAGENEMNWAVQLPPAVTISGMFPGDDFVTPLPTNSPNHGRSIVSGIPGLPHFQRFSVLIPMSPLTIPQWSRINRRLVIQPGSARPIEDSRSGPLMLGPMPSGGIPCRRAKPYLVGPLGVKSFSIFDDSDPYRAAGWRRLRRP